MQSVGEQLVQAMCNALNAPVTKPCTTYRSRVDFLASSELPAMVIFAIRDDASERSNATTLHRRTVRVEMVVEGEPPADVAIDALYVYVVQTLSNSSVWDPASLGIRRLEEKGIQMETEASYSDATAAVLDFEIVYVAKADDPTTKVML